MAVLAIFTGNGITRQMYDSLRYEVQWESNPPAGGLFHACAFDKRGNLHVVDVWESVEAMNEFASKRLLPSMKKLGIPPWDVGVFPAQNIDVYPAALRFLLGGSKAQSDDEDLRAALLEGLRDDGYRD